MARGSDLVLQWGTRQARPCMSPGPSCQWVNVKGAGAVKRAKSGERGWGAAEEGASYMPRTAFRT